MAIGNPKVIEYLDSHYQPLDSDMEQLRAVNEENEVPLILRETEGFLSVMLDIVKPDNILEIGTAYGYSALFFSRKRPNAKVTTIDRSSHMIANANSNFENYDIRNQITFLTGDAEEVLSELIDKSEAEDTEKFDFVFIDAGKSHYKEFFDKCEKLCKPGTVVVCDNIMMHGWLIDRTVEGAKRHRTNVKYMRQFIDYIHEREDLSVSLLASGDGLAVIKLNDR